MHVYKRGNDLQANFKIEGALSCSGEVNKKNIVQERFVFFFPF